MKKDVLISIRGTQLFEGCDNEVIELVTNGRLYRKDKRYYITYQESELTGLQGTTTTLKVEPRCVTLMRSGSNPGHLMFEEGRRHNSMYETGAGAVTICVSTKSIHNTLSDSGGSLKVDYAVEIDHALAGCNMIAIDVKELTGAQQSLKN